MTQHTIQPRWGQLCLVRRSGGYVTDDVWCADLSNSLPNGSRPWREGSWQQHSDIVAWAEMPKADDPRWRTRLRGEPELVAGDRYICLHDYGGRTWINVREYLVGHMAFPGFMGGEHVHWERVKLWMPTDAITTWHTMSPEWLRLPTKAQWRHEQMELWALRRGQDVALAIINDGEEYRKHWSAFSRGEPVRIRRYKCSVKDVRRPVYIVDRAGMLRQWAFGLANAWCQRNSALWLDDDADQTCIDWSRAARYAAECLLDHYRRSYDDEQRIREQVHA